MHPLQGPAASRPASFRGGIDGIGRPFAGAVEGRQSPMWRGVDTSPVQHWTQGAGRVASAIAGSLRRGQIDDAIAENRTWERDLLVRAPSARSPQPISGVNDGTPTVASNPQATFAPLEIGSSGAVQGPPLPRVLLARRVVPRVGLRTPINRRPGISRFRRTSSARCRSCLILALAWRCSQEARRRRGSPTRHHGCRRRCRGRPIASSLISSPTLLRYRPLALRRLASMTRWILTFSTVRSS